MRSGKWTEDEVSFAMRLIHEFENGIISGVSPKVTLRAFLAQQLCCNPMRISKKFAGRCVGKRPYASYKMNATAAKSPSTISNSSTKNTQDCPTISSGSSSSYCYDDLIMEDPIYFDGGDSTTQSLTTEKLNKSKKRRCDQLITENSSHSFQFSPFHLPRSSTSSSSSTISSNSSYSSCSSLSSLSHSTTIISPEDWAIAATCFKDSQSSS